MAGKIKNSVLELAMYTNTEKRLKKRNVAYFEIFKMFSKPESISVDMHGTNKVPHLYMFITMPTRAVQQHKDDHVRN